MAERDLPLSRVPLRLLLDARVPLVRLRVGPARRSPTRPACCRGSRRGACGSACGSTRTSRSARRCSPKACRTATCVKQAERRCLAVGPVAGRAWRLVDFTNPDAAALVSRTSCAACSTWASTASRPTSASGSRPTSSTPTAPTRCGCTTTTRYLYNEAVFEVLREHARRRRGGRCSPARPPPAGQQFPVHWGGDCCRHVRVDGREPARRAVARPVRLRLLEPRHRRLRGHPDPAVYKRWIAVRPAVLAQPPARQRAPTGCRGCSTRKRSTCCATSPSSSAG